MAQRPRGTSARTVSLFTSIQSRVCQYAIRALWLLPRIDKLCYYSIYDMAHRIETDAGKNTYYVTNTDGDVMWSNLTRREAEHLCSVMTEEAPEEWWDIFDAEVTPYE